MSLLGITGLSKTFGSLKALDSVDFEADSGEIHALLGENGAGKSTLMNVVFGFIRPDSGQVLFNGSPLVSHNPRKSMLLGIGMVHQHFKLVDEFTVGQNIALGSRRFKDVLSNWPQNHLGKLMEQTGLVVDPKAVVGSLPLGLRQRVEILKALFRGAKLLILDEPTAVLTPNEIRELFESLRRLRDSGAGIIIITHKLREALSISDRVTVLRSGKSVLSVKASETDEKSIASAMVGREVLPLAARAERPGGEILLKVESASFRSESDCVKDFSVELRSGEILGVAGVEGNGQNALLNGLSGLIRPVSGNVELMGSDISGLGVKERFLAGLAHIPGDRQKQALLGEFSLTENLLLGLWPQKKYRTGPFVRSRAIAESVGTIIKNYDIQGAVPETLAMSLSGGNQQRFVVGRQMSSSPRVLVAANPTRGLDIGAIDYVHRRLLEQADLGGAVILISTDLDEILTLSDRILVLYDGTIAGEFHGGTPKEEIGLAMTGGSKALGT